MSTEKASPLAGAVSSAWHPGPFDEDGDFECTCPASHFHVGARGKGHPATLQAREVWVMPTRVLSEAQRPKAFLGRARGPSVAVETSPRWGKPRLALSWMLTHVERVPPGTLPTSAPKTLLTRSPWTNLLAGQRWGFPALSWLRTWRSVVPSFLPKAQSQRGQLAGHGHAQDGRIDSLLGARVVVVLKRSGARAARPWTMWYSALPRRTPPSPT